LARLLSFLWGGCILFCLQKKQNLLFYCTGKAMDGRLSFHLLYKVLVLTLLASGGIFGTAEVIAVAFAQAQGNVADSMYPRWRPMRLASLSVGII